MRPLRASSIEMWILSRPRPARRAAPAATSRQAGARSPPAACPARPAEATGVTPMPLPPAAAAAGCAGGRAGSSGGRSGRRSGGWGAAPAGTAATWSHQTPHQRLPWLGGGGGCATLLRPPAPSRRLAATAAAAARRATVAVAGVAAATVRAWITCCAGSSRSAGWEGACQRLLCRCCPLLHVTSCNPPARPAGLQWRPSPAPACAAPGAVVSGSLQGGHARMLVGGGDGWAQPALLRDVTRRRCCLPACRYT